MTTSTVHDKLLDWGEIRENFENSSLLIGNGASMSVWDKFGYSSLLKATEENENYKLNPEDYELFKKLDTKNFEQILGSLKNAVEVSEALGLDPNPYSNPYGRIRDALGEAVNRVHLSWDALGEARRKSLCEALSSYDFVFTTNYDLIVYWSVMENPTAFKDYFWSKEFDVSDVEIRGKYTKLLFLHGALHLYRTPPGSVLKAKSGVSGPDLLTKFPSAFGEDADPLFISEGSSKDKLKSIFRSDYLSFAYSEFSDVAGRLVVFGHGLSDSDQHLLDVIAAWSTPKIAVSIRTGTPSKEIILKKASLQEQLPEAELFFYSSETHPLGSPDLQVQ